MSRRIDQLGLVFSLASLVALIALPFATLRANRIVPGVGHSVFDALPSGLGILPVAAVALAGAASLFVRSTQLRLALGALALLVLLLCLGPAPAHLLDGAAGRYARVSPASGFWLTFGLLCLLLTHGLTLMRPSPAMRIVFLVVAAVLLGSLFATGWFDGLSVFREYDTRADSFWREARHHLVLVVGALAAACAVGIPLGIACQKVSVLRNAVLGTLDVIQTIPSIALFGLLIAPLAYLAAHVPLASALGLSGIGTAPAFVALFLYSLLPMTANTMAGLSGVPQDAEDAAKGAGMTARQRLLQVELPLALPLILAGVRIVLVQNIGLATVAALIGGGGLGVFVFQGVGQTAMDLVLLGALPTVGLAFGCAVLLDALIDLSRRGRSATP